MSHSTNSKVSFCDVCDLSFESKKVLYRHQSYDSKHNELLEKMLGSDDEAPIDVKPKAEKVIPPSSQTIPENLTQKKNITSSDLNLKGLCPWSPKKRVSLKLRVSLKGLCSWFPKLRVYLKITPKKLFLLNPSINLKLKLKIVSAAELSIYFILFYIILYVKNVMQNFFKK